jgi:hypothetical protein
MGEQVAMLAGESPAPLGCGFLNHRNNVDWKERQATLIGHAGPQLAT